MPEPLFETGKFPQIVVVDDDELMRETLETYLSRNGFEVTGFGDGPTTLNHLATECSVDLVLLDWKLTHMSGIEMLQTMHANGTNVPVIVFTTLTDQLYEEAALASGAVDFVNKARGFTILLKRIELALGKARTKTDRGPIGEAKPCQEYGDLIVDNVAGRVTWQSKHVPLSWNEVTIVSHFAARRGLNVPFRELYDLVRGKDFVAGAGPDGYRNNVRGFIKRIRRKFRGVDEEFDEIKNFPGFGYRWCDSEEEQT